MTNSTKYKTLIVYHNSAFPQRKTIIDHLDSFKLSNKLECYYLNMAYRRSVPRYFADLKFDVVIFHTTFLSTRWDRGLFKELMERCHKLSEISGVRLVFPQDEFISSDLLCEFIRRYNIDHVFSVSPASEWPKIYREVIDNTTISGVLTGYLDEETLEYIKKISGNANREIGIGYRAWKADYCLGKHGKYKTEIADIFSAECLKRGITHDISTESSDTIYGYKWYDFLSNCRFTIGVEGGASILDRDGSLRKKTLDYTRCHPRAAYEEVEAECFPHRDGEIEILALSPRHLEAVATKTCQILIEGDYNGLLKPWVHYIPIMKDYGNMEEVFRCVADEQFRVQMIERAYDDIITNKKCGYFSFIKSVNECIEGLIEGEPTSTSEFKLQIINFTHLIYNLRVRAQLHLYKSMLKACPKWIIVPVKQMLKRFVI